MPEFNWRKKFFTVCFMIIGATAAGTDAAALEAELEPPPDKTTVSPAVLPADSIPNLPSEPPPAVPAEAKPKLPAVPAEAPAGTEKKPAADIGTPPAAEKTGLPAVPPSTPPAAESTLTEAERTQLVETGDRLMRQRKIGEAAECYRRAAGGRETPEMLEFFGGFLCRTAPETAEKYYRRLLDDKAPWFANLSKKSKNTAAVFVLERMTLRREGMDKQEKYYRIMAETGHVRSIRKLAAYYHSIKRADLVQKCQQLLANGGGTLPSPDTPPPAQTVLPGRTNPRAAAGSPPSASSQNNDEGLHCFYWLDGMNNLELIRIRNGSFLMGSPEDEDKRESDEKQHSVTLTRDFYLGVYEVTQGQYQELMGVNPAYSKGGKDYPVELVTKAQALEFCERLNQRFAKKLGNWKFTLPTEAQWEYACRAGSKGPFGAICSRHDNRFDRDYQYLNFVGSGGGDYDKDKRFKTCPVTSTHSNRWGLYGMHGNVGEWVLDGYQDYEHSERVDPFSEVGEPVCRGGSWQIGNYGCRSARRYRCPVNNRKNSIGFRVALVEVKIPDDGEQSAGPDFDYRKKKRR